MKKHNVQALFCFFIVWTPSLAEISTDGTVGPEGRLSGPNYHIGQELGSLRGNNLFHSFGRFNLNNSESATFTGDSHIRNVISRVTGGAPSTIDGTLKSEIGRAAFYFINPAGIVFGEHAQVDVPGAFYASTAGELQFADGSKFSATNPQGNTLSMAAPEAFGFLGKQTGTMAIKGADLVFKPSSTVHLSGGKITMNNANLKGEGMDLQLASLGNSTQAVGVKTLPNQALSGSVSINNTLMDGSGNGKGRIAVRAGDVEIVNSQINANNIGNLNMAANQGIDMRVGGLSLDDSDITSDAIVGNSGSVNISVQNELKVVKGGSIRTATFGKGDAGKVRVKAEKIHIDGKDKNIGTITGIASRVIPGATGNAGAVIVSAQKELNLINAGTISSSTFGHGDAGNVTVKAKNIQIDGQNATFDTGITSDVTPSASGKAGTVTVSAENELIMENGGRISSLTQGKGNAGTLTVKAGSLQINDQNAHLNTGILSDAFSGSTGNAGTVNVSVENELVLVNGGRISSLTYSEGEAGVVNVKAGNLLINNDKSDFFTGITTSAIQGSIGNAGTININVQKELVLVNGGLITSTTEGRGNGGNVNVISGKILIDDRNSKSPTGISTETNFSGHAGNINIRVEKEIILLNTGQITSSTFGKGNAGKVIVNAETIGIENQIDSKFLTGIASRSELNAEGSPGQVSVSARKSISMNTGDISISSGKFSNKLNKTNAKLTITAPQLNLSNNSRISAESSGNLPASPIEIKTSQLSMDNSKITTATVKSDGGSITLNANDWALLKNSQITTSVGNSNDAFGTNVGNGGDITINTDVLVLDTGFIQANTNVLNASGGGINLNVKQLVASSGNLQSGGNKQLTFKPNSGINVIQAAAPDGINGTITNTAPQLNIVGTLVGLNTPQLDLNRVGHDPCSSIAQQSTMKKLGKGGIPYFNKGQDGYTIDRLLPKQHDKAAQTTELTKALPDSHDCRPKASSHDHNM